MRLEKGIMSITDVNDLPQLLRDVPAPTVSVQPESEEARAAHLRALPLQRMMGYGVELGDALMIRSMVESGIDWIPAAEAVAERALALALGPGATEATRRRGLQRASAALRIAQIVESTDTAGRTARFLRSAEFFEQSVAGDQHWRRVVVPHAAGDLFGWWVRPVIPEGTEVPTVIVIGGMEGWAEDHSAVAGELTARGVGVVLLDGPGQGVTRMRSHHYLGPDFVDGYRAVVDWIVEEQRSPRPIGIWGNSMGGNFAMHVAAADPRIAACCNNGGGCDLGILGRERSRVFEKMRAMCGPVDDDIVWQTFATTDLTADRVRQTCPTLVVVAGEDQLIPREDMTVLYDRTPAADKQMFVFEDAEHCVYRHPDEKHAVIADWFVDKLEVKS